MALEIGIGRLVGRDHAGAGPPLDGHVADGHPRLHRQRPDGLAAVLDDVALSTLPRFPALTELMPMDVTDHGFRHVGHCPQLESLILMYCRETTDVATEHIAGLSKLKRYYAGGTQITDRSLGLLGQMSSLEHLEFDACAGLTDAGVACLAGLPQLREISIEGSPNVTREGMAIFPATVRVNYK